MLKIAMIVRTRVGGKMRIRFVITAVALVAALAAPVARAATETGTSPYPIGPGGRAYTPPAPTYGTSEDADVSVRMNDGVILKADVVYPTDLVTGERAVGPFPILMTQNP